MFLCKKYVVDICSNPTPKTDELIDKVWPKYTKEKQEYLNISSQLTVCQDQKNLKVWHDYQKRFTGHI
jgi:carboxylesterase type B